MKGRVREGFPHGNRPLNETNEPTPDPSLEKGGEEAAPVLKAKKKYRIADKTKRARHLRNEATQAEKFLWTKLSRRQLGGFKFRRQYPYGLYVLDYYCVELKLSVEVDGGQHGEDRVRRKDEIRTSYLGKAGVTVIRFWNYEVLSAIDGVMDAILEQAHAIAKENMLFRQNSEAD